MRHEGEPSVEEILESIKKVIARDNRDAQQAERRRRESAGVMLTPGKPTDYDGNELEDEEVLDLTAEAGEAGEAGEVVEAAAATPQEALTTESAAQSMRESLAALAMIAEPSAPPQIVRSGETSLEALTRDLLRPMLAEWLDRNLPEIVERLVKAEISRIAGKKG
jgi:cell pole-organizing protein PopZ